MKKLLFGFILLIASHSFSQVSGDLVTDQRKIVSEISFEKEMKATGILVFDISVDNCRYPNI